MPRTSTKKIDEKPSVTKPKKTINKESEGEAAAASKKRRTQKAHRFAYEVRKVAKAHGATLNGESRAILADAFAFFCKKAVENARDINEKRATIKAHDARCASGYFVAANCHDFEPLIAALGKRHDHIDHVLGLERDERRRLKGK